MRALGKDIAELFGFAPDDMSPSATDAFHNKICPFSKRKCSKTDHLGKMAYGVCSVTNGSSKDKRNDVIVCPVRIYANDYNVLQLVAEDVWKSEFKKLVVGGTLEILKNNASAVPDSVVAFGQHSGKEVSAGSMSMDWVLQRYKTVQGCLQPQDFVGIEIQSIDITGNYRGPWNAYQSLKNGTPTGNIPSSEHGLNWANVHKRLIPQLIRKGNIYSRTTGARGFFFVTPEQVFKRFENVLGTVATAKSVSRDNISIITLELDPNTSPGSVRSLVVKRRLHISLHDLATAFVNHVEADAPDELEQSMKSIL
jgi:hypothetical protein